MVNSIKSHPPHSLCGLLKTGGGEAGDWDVCGGGEITESLRPSFTTCLWVELLKNTRCALKKLPLGSDSACKLLRRDTSRPSYQRWHQYATVCTNTRGGDLYHFTCACQLPQAGWWPSYHRLQMSSVWMMFFLLSLLEMCHFFLSLLFLMYCGLAKNSELYYRSPNATNLKSNKCNN